jgi:hypothetical protein
MKLNKGKLYASRGEEFIVNVDYKLYHESESSSQGELKTTEYRRLSDGDGYIIELQDGFRSRCSLRKKINQAVSGIPPLYHYYFKMHESFE